MKLVVLFRKRMVLQNECCLILLHRLIGKLCLYIHVCKTSKHTYTHSSLPFPVEINISLNHQNLFFSSPKIRNTGARDVQQRLSTRVLNEPKRAHVTPLFISLHWRPVAARIQFKTLMLAYRTTKGSAPTYFHSLLRIYIPSRSLRSASERRLVVPSQRGSKSLSRTFSFTVPGRWNDLPTPIRTAGSLSIFKQQMKTHLYLTT